MKKTTGLLVAVCLCLAAVVLPLTQAGTITVTNPNDSGPGSLRQAIADALPGDEIQFDPSLDGEPIHLTSGQLYVCGLTISGRGPERTILAGDGQTRVVEVYGDLPVTISGVTITGGRGGILKRDTAELTVSYSTISGNRARDGGGIDAQGNLTVTHSTISDNEAERSGGGIRGSETVHIRNSTIRDNRAGDWGGGVYRCSDACGMLMIDNSTLTGNSAASMGGGVGFCSGLWCGWVEIHNSTITDNSAETGGGLFSDLSGIWNSIIADQSQGEDCYPHRCWATYSFGHNLDSDGTCCLTEPTDIPNGDPRLRPIADNGGPTWTHAPHPQSPAIDAGCECGPADQRGMHRPWDGDRDGVATCDIGAYEYGSKSFASVLLAILPIQDLILSLSGHDYDLEAPLQAAIQVLEDGDPSNDSEAVGHLQAFIAEVEERRGWTLTDAEADQLIAEAQRIIALLNFGGSPIRNN